MLAWQHTGNMIINTVLILMTYWWYAGGVTVIWNLMFKGSYDEGHCFTQQAVSLWKMGAIMCSR